MRHNRKERIIACDATEFKRLINRNIYGKRIFAFFKETPTKDVSLGEV